MSVEILFGEVINIYFFCKICSGSPLQRPLEPWPWARTTDVIAPRSPPPPSLPGGPAHKLANNYYVSRDLRRDVAPPTILSSHKQLKESSEELTR